MKKVLKGIAVVTGIIGAAKVMEQANNHNRSIYRLAEENNELQNEVCDMKHELSMAKWEQDRVRSDVNWIERMRKQDNNARIEMRRKLHDLTIENIELNGKINRMEIRNKPLKELAINLD